MSLLLIIDVTVIMGVTVFGVARKRFERLLLCQTDRLPEVRQTQCVNKMDASTLCQVKEINQIWCGLRDLQHYHLACLVEIVKLSSE